MKDLSGEEGWLAPALRAAVPLSVRKGSAFPVTDFLLLPEAEPQEKTLGDLNGKPQAYRKESGKAAVESRGQKAEVGDQKSEVGSQYSCVRQIECLSG